MATEYGSITFNGEIHISSKEPKEGFVKYPAKNGKVYYRKVIEKGIDGTLESIEIGNHPFFKGNPELFKIALKTDEGDLYVLELMSRDIKGYYTDMTKSLIATLPNLEKGVKYKFSPYSFIPEGGKNTFRGISFKSPETDVKIERLTQARKYKDGSVVEGDIPAEIWTQNKITKKNEKNSDNQTLFLMDVVEKEIPRFARGPYTPTTTTKATSKPENVTKAELPNVDDKDDNLPF